MPRRYSCKLGERTLRKHNVLNDREIFVFSILRVVLAAIEDNGQIELQLFFMKSISVYLGVQNPM